MASISVLTIVHQRSDHLSNLIQGLNQSTRLPNELIIIHMNEPTTGPLPSAPYPVRRVSLQSSATKIPLAQARNRAVSCATGERLVFLDVDCIPNRHLVAQYEQADFEGVLMGDIHYLPAGATQPKWTFEQLARTAVPHPRRPVVTQRVQSESRYELFWTLNFTVLRSVYEQLGGLDEAYQGYGAEDTDFAFTARQQGVPFALSSARAYHQHHAVYRPPLQHFGDIIVNAQRFYQKWQHWPMDGWLEAFRTMGLIEWSHNKISIVTVRMPTQQEIEAAYDDAPAGF